MTIEKMLPFLILSTVGLSGLLLGMGQGDFEPLFVAVTGASAAFILVDWLKWFRLPQWLANLLAIIVTIVTVSNFYFTNDSVRHLLGVGKLLVYLQTILLFQRKSSRVYWQVLVLSLLQIVVGAVFNLGFEGGVLFIVYMMVTGVTMMLLHLYQDRQINRIRNEDYVEFSKSVRQSMVSRPIALCQNGRVPRSTLRRMIGSFCVFATGALFFSILLFYFLPRDHSSWAGPKEVPMRVTGFEEKVDLNHSEMILLSSQLEMNVRYWYPGKEEVFHPPQQPYLRGVALSNIQIDGNRTKWVPPPYQVYTSDFRPLRSGRDDANWVIQEITLEPTEDPLLYTVMPPRIDFEDELVGEYEWCWPLGGLTRQRASEKIAVSHYRYDLKIPILENGEFHSAYQYVPRDGPVSLTPEEDLGNYKWLTWLDRDRYPTIVQVGEQLSERIQSDNHYALAKQMESWFLTDRFRYSLDFRDIERDENIDTTEDFFANFRSGHCEYFASALALMLRSQGIPARMVIGFRGGDVNDFGGHLDVEARHKHAWVEAYVRPGDCPQRWFQTGQASRRRGAWMRLDPTPAVDLDSLTSSDDALDFAKSLWRDYVLGLQSETQDRVFSSSGLHMSGLFRFLDLEWWQQSFRNVTNNLKQPGGWQKLVLGLVVLIGMWLAWVLVKRNRQKQMVEASGTVSYVDRAGKPGWLRRSMARVLQSVSPRLAEWVAGTGNAFEEIAFYSRMLRALERAGFQRQPHQTQREFARHVAVRTSENGGDPSVGSLANTITDFYYLVRFGAGNLDSTQSNSVDQALADLEEKLAQQA